MAWDDKMLADENQRAMGSMAGIAGIAADSNVQIARPEGPATPAPSPVQRGLAELEHMVQSAHLCASALEEGLAAVLTTAPTETLGPSPDPEVFGHAPITDALHGLTGDVARLCARLASMKQRLEI